MEQAAAGEPFVICKASRSLVCVMPLNQASGADTKLRRLGLLAGQCEVPADLDRMAAGQIADLLTGA